MLETPHNLVRSGIRLWSQGSRLRAPPWWRVLGPAMEPLKELSRSPCSPPLAAAWSFQRVSHGRPERPRWWVTLAGMVFCCASVCDEIAYAGTLLGSSNGRWVSFFKSVHQTNYFWYKSRFVSRSVIGAILLKFVGSTVISLSLGKTTIWSTSPRHVVSFLLAFAFVRSDSWEARELSGHMRHIPTASLGLNLMAALYKLRKLNFLVDHSPQLGTVPTLLVGIVAFSAANCIMAAERHVVLFLRRRRQASPHGPQAGAALRPGGALEAYPIGEHTDAHDGHPATTSAVASMPTASADGGRPASVPAEAQAEPARHPSQRTSRAAHDEPAHYPDVAAQMLRNAFFLCTLLAAQRCGDAVHAAAKVLVLALLCRHYNKGLMDLLMGYLDTHTGTVSAEGQPELIRLPAASTTSAAASTTAGRTAETGSGWRVGGGPMVGRCLGLVLVFAGWRATATVPKPVAMRSASTSASADTAVLHENTGGVAVRRRRADGGSTGVSLLEAAPVGARSQGSSPLGMRLFCATGQKGSVKRD